jgi:hypothetical protein
VCPFGSLFGDHFGINHDYLHFVTPIQVPSSNKPPRMMAG